MAVCRHCGVKIIRIANQYAHIPVNGERTPKRQCQGGRTVASNSRTKPITRAYFVDKAINRFWRRVKKTDTCWIWQGYKRRHGYGTVMLGRKEYRVHRLAYVLAHGEIPDGMVLDHICRNASCVNPAHLEAVTQKENVRRGLRNPESRAKILNTAPQGLRAHQAP